MKNYSTEEEVCKKQESVFSDRKRTSFFAKPEQKFIFFLVKKVPANISSDMLTGIGLAGSVIVLISFVLGHTVARYYLLFGLPGILINWFGDSLDGRLAYYRRIPRKWYGFSLDIIVDWLSIIITGTGFLIYAEYEYKIFGFLFVCLYGWAMILTLLRFKIYDEYIIDTGLIGPTELRLILAVILIGEVLLKGILEWSAVFISLTFFATNLHQTFKVLAMGNIKDQEEKLNQ